uniref:RNA-directed RNA polymerase n=2 Tax=Orthornavirae TaxID=2732396 RepID=A0A7S6Z3A4_9MONO|nr:ORF7 Large protein [Lentinula edodes negative-strand RNA virus 1]UZA97547.1 RNA-dependent RNA polymerase [Lentinula edodes narnavirus 1]
MSFLGSSIGDLEDELSSKSIFFIDQHLSSPVLDTPVKRAMSIFTAIREGQPVPKLPKDRQFPAYHITSMLVRTATFPDLRIIPVEPDMYSSFIPKFSISYENSKLETDSAWEIASPLLGGVRLATDHLTGVPTAGVLNPWEDADTRMYHMRMRWWESLQAMLAKSKGEGNIRPVKVVIDNRMVLMDTSVWYIQTDPDSSVFYCLSYDQVMMFKDWSYMRLNSLLADQILFKEKRCSERMKDIWSWQEECLDRYGNKGYELAKMVESLGRSYLSYLTDRVISPSDSSYTHMLQKCRDKEMGLLRTISSPFPRSLVAEDIDRIFTSVVDISVAVELFGLQKMSGHPTIDPRVGGKSASTEARIEEDVSVTDIQRLRGNWCRIFTESFIEKNHRWPRLRFPSDQKSVLRSLYVTGILRIHRESYPLEDWVGVQFEKEFDFDYYEHYLELIDDKSISYYRDEKAYAWTGEQARSHRRLLVELLTRPNVDTKALVRQIEQDGIPDSWRIVTLYPKEREFKLAARMFSMMVFEMRLFFTIHEANLGDTILPFIPQLTMVDSKLSVHQRFLDMTAPLPDEEFIRLFLELDLSRWNLRWRSCTIDPIGHDLNCLFGMRKVFTTAHSFFSSATIMVRVSDLPPDDIEKDYPPESDLLWYNHHGGFEGIIQKLWSIATVAMIDLALHKKNIAFKLTGQGDNVILSILEEKDPSLTVQEQVKRLRDVTLKDASIITEKLNHDLKPEECVVSTSVLTYSKECYIDGVDYPTSIKALSRVFPHDAVDFTSIGSRLGSIFSSCVAAAEKAKDPILCYHLALIHGAMFLSRLQGIAGPYSRVVRAGSRQITTDVLQKMLLLPADLGGLPVLGYNDFLYRGGSDPLSKTLAGLSILSPYISHCRDILAAVEDDRFYNAHPSLEALLQDPYSIPISKPVSPSDRVGNKVVDVLKLTCKNRDISELLSYNDDQYREQLLEAVKGITPFNPVIVRDIVDCSILGTVDVIRRMFTQTRTLQMVGRTIGAGNLGITLVQAGGEQYLACAYRCALIKPKARQVSTIFALVNSARQRWNACGVHVEGVSSYQPCDFPLRWGASVKPPEVRCLYRPSQGPPRYTRGPERAYLGSPTIEKRSEHGYRIIGRSFTASALRKLSLIYSQSDQGDGIRSILSQLFHDRSGVSLASVSHSLPSIRGGSSHHRYAARIGFRGAGILGQTTFATHCVLDSNDAGYLAGSTDDYPVMFQEFFLYMMALADIRVAHRPQREILVTGIVIGGDEIVRLPPYAFSAPEDTRLSPLVKRAALLYDSSVEVRRVSGPFVSGGIGVRLWAGDEKQLIWAALISKFRQVFRRYGSYRAHLDQTPFLPADFIDLRELAAIGLKSYIQCAALASYESIVGIVSSHALMGTHRTTTPMLVRKYSGVIMSPVIRYLNHPLMQRDPWIQAAQLRFSLAYQPSRLIHSSLQAMFAKAVDNMLSLKGEHWYRFPYVIFRSDPEDSVSRGVVTRLRSMLHYHCSFLGVPWSMYSKIISRVVTRMQQSRHSTEQETLDDVRQMLTDLITDFHYGVSAHRLLTLSIFHLIHGTSSESLVYCDSPSDKIVRLARDWGVAPVPTFSSTYTSRPIRTADRGDPVVLHLDSVAESPIADEERSRLRLLHRHKKHLRRPFSALSGAIASWATISHYFHQRTVYVVGSGLGACAAVALTNDATVVYGLDLLADIDSRTVHPTLSKPPLVTLYGGDERYFQSPATSLEGGDWLERGVASRFLEHCNHYSLVCIDIPSQVGRSPGILTPLNLVQYKGLVAVRVQGTLGELTPILSACSVLLGDLKIHTLRSPESYIEAVIVGRWLMKPIRYRTVPCIQTVSFGSVLENEKLCVSSALEELAFASGVSVSTSVKETCGRIVSEISNEIGTYSSRPTYRSWTTALGSCVASTWLLSEDRHYRDEIIRRVTSEQTVELRRVGLPNIPVRWTPQLSRLVLVVAAALDGRA